MNSQGPTSQTPAKYCEKGAQIREALERSEQAIRQTQQKMRAVADAEDPIDRRVPRNLHESLKQEMQARALNRLQWTRHVEKCWDCTLASNKAARPQQPANLAA